MQRDEAHRESSSFRPKYGFRTRHSVLQLLKWTATSAVPGWIARTPPMALPCMPPTVLERSLRRAHNRDELFIFLHAERGIKLNGIGTGPPLRPAGIQEPGTGGSPCLACIETKRRPARSARPQTQCSGRKARTSPGGISRALRESSSPNALSCGVASCCDGRNGR